MDRVRLQAHAIGHDQARLVNDRNRKAENRGVSLGEPHRSKIRSDDHPVSQRCSLERARQERDRARLIERDPKEALDRRIVQIDGHHAIEASRFEQIGNQVSPPHAVLDLGMDLAIGKALQRPAGELDVETGGGGTCKRNISCAASRAPAARRSWNSAP